MKLLSMLPGMLALLASIAAASPPAPAKCQTTICRTTQLTTRAKTKPHTYYSSTTTPCTKRTTVDSTRTVTPRAYTTTLSRTSTVTITGVATTDTATTTTTITESKTSTDTVTSTATTTFTTAIGTTTTTVAAAATFVPIADSVPGSSNQNSVSNREKKARLRRGAGSEVDVDARSDKNPAARGLLLSSSNKQTYPGDVQCYKYYAKCTTSTVTKTCTRTAAKPTMMATTTVTSTVTTTPGVFTTSTATVTTITSVTETATATTTSTSTSTEFASTTSVYAACQTNNLAHFFNNQPLKGGTPDYNVVDYYQSPATSEYDCCVAALLDPLGAYFAWGLDRPSCYVFYSKSTCEASRASLAPVQVSDVSFRYALGNANCGQWTPPSGPQLACRAC